MTVPAHCTVCGKDFEMDDKYKTFVEKYPERVKCPDCMKGTPKPSAAKATSTAKSSYSKSTKSEVNAEMFVKAYDELAAAFGDRIDEVKEYLGGWTSTIVINRSR